MNIILQNSRAKSNKKHLKIHINHRFMGAA